MRRRGMRRIPVIFLTFLMILSLIPVPVRAAQETTKSQNLYNNTAKWLVEHVSNPTSASSKGEWVVFGLARSGYKVPDGYFDIYIANATTRLTEANGVLSNKKYTEYSRMILAMTAIGQDATNVGGYNLLNYLSDYDKVIWQRPNGPAWALIALDSNGYEIPTAADGVTQNTREGMVAWLLSQQHEDGGWSLDDYASDVDVTAMVLQSLSTYYNANEKVKAAIERGLEYLITQQNDDGTFSTIGVKNAESTAQVLVTLTCLGIDPNQDSRFIKEGRTLFETLCLYGVEDGGFHHVFDGNVNQMATEQFYYALAAYFRFINNQSSLYRINEAYTVSKLELPNESTSNMEENSTAQTEDGVSKDSELTSKELAGKTKSLNQTTDTESSTEKKTSESETNTSEKSTTKAVTKTADSTVKGYTVSNATKKVINHIKKMTDEETSIMEAYKLYEALSEEEKLFVTNRKTLLEKIDFLAETYHFDEKTGIDARNNEENNLPWYVKIIAQETELEKQTLDALRESLGEETEVLTCYQISFLDERTGVAFIPDQPVTVQIPVIAFAENENDILVHIKEDNFIELL